MSSYKVVGSPTASYSVTKRGTVRARDLALGPSRWKAAYSHGLALTDLFALTAAVAMAGIFRFGLDSSATTGGNLAFSYTMLGVLVGLVWWVALGLFRSRDPRLIGSGVEEYQRLTRATVLVFGWVAIASLLLKTDLSRGYLALAFPLGLVLLLFNRRAWRFWLRRHRGNGRCMSRVLVIGGVRSAASLTKMFDRDAAGSGFEVTGVWVPNRSVDSDECLGLPARPIPVMGAQHSLASALITTKADSVVVTDTEHLGADGLRDLTWQLQGVDVDLMVSPNVVDVAGARIHMRAVAGMPLLHLEEPQYAEAGLWPKIVFDKVVALVALTLASPIMIITALLIKLTSPGPIFFYQNRVGLNGETFEMIKFRSMTTDAQSRQGELLALQGTADTPLFKVKNDPRITWVGQHIRRFSVDELPQLLNVLRGDMSLVGPRPQQRAEVDLYDEIAFRRLTVRPGMTGLWQVSGRSNLSWDDAIRLDTYYVENWSLTADLTIMFRTVRAVIGSRGAV